MASTWKSWSYIPRTLAHFAQWAAISGGCSYLMVRVFPFWLALAASFTLAMAVGLLTTLVEIKEYEIGYQDRGKTVIDLCSKLGGLGIGIGTILIWHIR